MILKRILYSSILLILLTLTVQAQTGVDQPISTLKVQIKGIEKVRGIVEVTLFNSRKKWLKKGGAYLLKRVEVDGKDVEVVFEGLPFGEYAFVSYHDVNSNEKFDKSMLGFPKEPFALSQKPRTKMRKPRYNEMKFTITEEECIRESRFRVF